MSIKQFTFLQRFKKKNENQPPKMITTSMKHIVLKKNNKTKR